MRYYSALLLISVGLSITAAYSQKITNITFKANEDNTISVFYTLKRSGFNQSFDISLYVSQDNGQTFQGPLKAVSGAVGPNVSPGANQISWDVFKDVVSLDGSIKFEVRANVINEKKKWFVMYHANTSLPSTEYLSPIGLRFGKLGGVGYYANIHFNPDFLNQNNSNYSFDGGQIESYSGTGYYVFSANDYIPRFAATVGLNFQVGPDLFLYSGAGIGIKNLIYEAEEFSYENSMSTGLILVQHEEFSTTGLELEVGAIIRIQSFLLSIGYSNLDFKYSFIDAGLGIQF